MEAALARSKVTQLSAAPEPSGVTLAPATTSPTGGAAPKRGKEAPCH